MASNLSEYYASKGMTLPSVNSSERLDAAAKAGITGYTGTADQNNSLLGYLNKLPNQGNGNVITSESLAPETPIKMKSVTDTGTAGLTGSISSLIDTTKATIAQEQADYDKQSAELAAAMKSSGDTGEYQETVYREQGVDTSKKVRDSLLSRIEQEQKSALDKQDFIRRNSRGTVAGASAEMERANRESANNLANYGIALSAASRDYDTASNIATRLVNANTDRIKADIESRKFVLEQLGTTLATNKANALTLQLKQIDKQDGYIQDAIKVATDGAKDGTIDGTAAFQAIQNLSSGKISISDFYSELGVDSSAGNIGGYDITTYATDPQHEIKVQSIYDTIGDVSDEETAQAQIDRLSPDSPITGKMVMDASRKYNVDAKLMLAIMQNDSQLGTTGKGVRTKNAGNVGNDDAGNEVQHDTWESGVDAVGKWLNGHRSTGVYKGEFLDTLQTVVDAGKSIPESTRKRQLESLKNYVASGNYSAAYTNIENAVANALEGENRTQFVAKRSAVPFIEDLGAKLKAYSNAGGKTGLLKGTYEDIYNKLGAVSDPAYKSLAADLRISLQQYRKNLSGAAFSAQEAADYESVNPSGKNSLDLNLSLIEGMKDNFQRYVDTNVDTIAGDGAKYIREYAKTGTGPSSKAPAQTFSTPGGYSYSIVGEGGGQQPANVTQGTPPTPPAASARSFGPPGWSEIMSLFN